MRTSAEFGFSLVEVLVALVILGVGGTMLSSLFTTSLKVQRHITQTNKAGGLEMTLHQLIENPSVCAASLAGLNTSRSHPQTIYLGMPGASPVMHAGMAWEGVKVQTLTAAVQQLSGTTRLVRIDLKLEKTAETRAIRNDWKIERYLNVVVDSAGRVTGCLSGNGGLIQVDNRQGILKPYGGANGYRFTYGSGSPSSGNYNATEDAWNFTDSRFYNNCAATTPERWLGCNKVDYESFTIQTPGTLMTVQAYGGLWIDNDSDTHTLGLAAGFEITCGSVTTRTKATALSAMRGTKLAIDGTSIPVSLATTPGGSCRVVPFVGWNWWPATALPTRRPRANFAAFGMGFSFSHYR